MLLDAVLAVAAEHPVRAVVEDLQLRLAWLNLDLLWAALCSSPSVSYRLSWPWRD